MCIPHPTTHSYWIVSPARAQHYRGEAFLNGIELIKRHFRRRRQLRTLAQLDDRLLDDVGLSREQVDEEIGRPIWHAYSRRHLK